MEGVGTEVKTHVKMGHTCLPATEQICLITVRLWGKKRLTCVDKMYTELLKTKTLNVKYILQHIYYVNEAQHGCHGMTDLYS